ncbi:HNH endonuclease [Pseudanabaena sp. 'Roaring Creek']|uniref:HNH endonuclease n=1 Tax=Pseudanabaena sp. 'Roaring Creek' TaxID=1681830 RepID=UPI0006D77CD2|nr:DUF3427 domain-containing protein [Pseudanabaena sp. 'Roaring Creek']
MFYPFKVNHTYTRKEIKQTVGVDENNKGGDWDTGYTSHEGDWFIFANIGKSGTTGHDYHNQWIENKYKLEWYTKGNRALHNETTINLLSPDTNKYIFYRTRTTDSFIFAGLGIAEKHEGNKPVKVLWRIETDLISKSSNPISTSINAERILAEPQIVYDVLSNTARQQKEYISSEESNIDSDKIESPNIMMRQIKERRGQKQFRQSLRQVHDDKCMITGCDITDILEAAHISSYNSDYNNHITNGLLLRADIHTLFDLDLLGIEPNDLTIHLHPTVKKDDYAQYEGKRLSCAIQLNRQSLDSRWQSFKYRLRN